MSGESGGELDASMLNVAMLDSAPGIFALEVGSSGLSTSDSSTVLVFAASVDVAGVGTVDLDALLAFIAQTESGGTGAVNVSALQAFAVAQVEVGGAGGVDLDAWLQMLHAQGDIAHLMGHISGEERVIMVYREHRTLKPEADGLGAIENKDRAVTI